MCMTYVLSSRKYRIVRAGKPIVHSGVYDEKANARNNFTVQFEYQIQFVSMGVEPLFVRKTAFQVPCDVFVRTL